MRMHDQYGCKALLSRVICGALALFLSITSLFTITYPFNVNGIYPFNVNGILTFTIPASTIVLHSTALQLYFSSVVWIRRRRRWEDNRKMDLQEVRCVGMDWIDLAQGRDRWRTRVNAVITVGFHKIRGISWLAANLASQERHCSMA
jgi:hypothetical protein